MQARAHGSSEMAHNDASMNWMTASQRAVDPSAANSLDLRSTYQSAATNSNRFAGRLHWEAARDQQVWFTARNEYSCYALLLARKRVRYKAVQSAVFLTKETCLASSLQVAWRGRCSRACANARCSWLT